MSANIPKSVIQAPLSGLGLLHRGKVRDTYALPGHSDKLLVCASDRISIFDFVLPALVALKGAILTAMNVFWRTQILKDLVSHDLVAVGSGIDEYLPGELRGDVGLQARATVVRKLKMIPIEAIVRGYLTGSGLKAYLDSRSVCGHRLPSGLGDGDALPFDIFTPTTKAEEGHDQHIDADGVAEKHGFVLERLMLHVFAVAKAHAYSRGIVLADTKCEFGQTPAGELVLGDEVLTPDSSRFWDFSEWQASRKPHTGRRSPTPFDKQLVREWGKELGINGRDPAKPFDVAWVHDQEVPRRILDRTTQTYRYILSRLIGDKLETFQRVYMGINTRPAPVNIELVSGSGSDVPQMEAGFRYLALAQQNGEVSVVRRHEFSCHRNSIEADAYARNLPRDCIVIAGAGMWAELPGMLKTRLMAVGKPEIPVIGVAFQGSSDAANQAARLAIEQLPGNPVVLKPDGTAYFGSHGFAAACVAAVENEFPPTPPAENKPARFDLPWIPKT